MNNVLLHLLLEVIVPDGLFHFVKHFEGDKWA